MYGSVWNGLRLSGTSREGQELQPYIVSHTSTPSSVWERHRALGTNNDHER